ncbi:zinc finger protein 345-like [Chelonia mydas]|uniref:zinc finger protein 345-like n=1 Tax=Chelonia mydas TaxID=8469 RepID=UPI001CAA0670|nr:zinc finger protein 345-like [Chelonia mydas]XP_043384172.1 zinc finger protein 345-like [Chelonia mydas]XP_043384173.1 zinc finger protein 345-like [Chelonia mydas]XP_043384174.1 zinc finger protein 345-like [Chelonia mydas]XP_043384175.1 zinc finger protein 345-like [Chelonia mydas]XP_043384176.1 zinc finger protein 345-like [Chelonia mydas]XP_043384177.1 zinc finger protein 345-like [Chelonia mydas]XP_043384178.1 zinc finger protein 345-like [Chelonia mydas]
MLHLGTHLEEASRRCGESPQQNSVLPQHQSIAFAIQQRILSRQKPCQCPDCGRGFVWSSTLMAHQRLHTGERPYKYPDLQRNPFQCPESRKCFAENSAQTKHQQFHPGESPYACPDCGKGFSLAMHRRVHIGKRPFLCPDCGMGFNQRAKLTVHQRAHEGERPNCRKSFGRRAPLGQPRRAHCGEKPCVCASSGKRFNVSALIEHWRGHMGERPDKRHEGGKSFGRRSDLAQRSPAPEERPRSKGTALPKHRVAERPYHCLDCGRTFSRRSNLLSHQRAALQVFMLRERLWPMFQPCNSWESPCRQLTQFMTPLRQQLQPEIRPCSALETPRQSVFRRASWKIGFSFGLFFPPWKILTFQGNF